MPRGDGTGPMGAGPMTGRSAGFCAGFDRPGFANPVPGRGFGMGYGRGRGRGMGMRQWGWGPQAAAPVYGQPPVYNTQIDPGAEKEMLKQQADAMKTQLDSVNKRLEDLEKNDSKK